MRQIGTETLGQCWLAVSELILSDGLLSHYDGITTKEVANLSLAVLAPDPQDAVIRRLGDPAWLTWMHENFFTQKRVEELGNAESYAIRLFNYAGQDRDQIRWIVEQLQKNPETRSATITTFMPLIDTSYIPCISLLDFWIPQEAVELVVYAHSLDFGRKAYGNLVELASLQAMIAQELGRSVGSLIIHVKSAHIYEPEWEFMRQRVQAMPVQHSSGH